jgi:hypothetical protein
MHITPSVTSNAFRTTLPQTTSWSFLRRFVADSWVSHLTTHSYLSRSVLKTAGVNGPDSELIDKQEALAR